MKDKSQEQQPEPVVFDFLISSAFLRNTLNDFVQNNNVPKESTIRIECIVQESAPVPIHEIDLSEWAESSGMFAASYTVRKTATVPGDKASMITYNIGRTTQIPEPQEF
ncbi:unnamed protein product [Gongylonema pulchrum]|uniref:Uncharacterized protein n=1 Tax=Gongylonema pulchrum TaxID=637853 RepID=A0A183DY76_9BILA|nr:unnamed protein product [Gongylonema pulchrum]